MKQVFIQSQVARGIQVPKQGEPEQDMNQRPESHFSTRQNTTNTVFIRNVFTFLTHCKWSVWLLTVQQPCVADKLHKLTLMP